MNRAHAMVAKAINSLDPTDQGDVLLNEVIMAIIVCFHDEYPDFDEDEFLEMLYEGKAYKEWFAGFSEQGDAS